MNRHTPTYTGPSERIPTKLETGNEDSSHKVQMIKGSWPRRQTLLYSNKKMLIKAGLAALQLKHKGLGVRVGDKRRAILRNYYCSFDI